MTNSWQNKRQTGGEGSEDKRGRSVERMRGGGDVMRGVATTSRKTRSKRGGAPADREEAVS
jgi:hypothetical protein